MTNWGNYGISAVKYNSKGTHIDQVQIHQNINGGVGNVEYWLRERVVSALKNNYVVITLPRNSEGGLTIGAQVIIDRINGIEYIKTVRDNTTHDNLGNLPRF